MDEKLRSTRDDTSAGLPAFAASGGSLSRRTAVRAVAWGAPVILVSVAVPAFAASGLGSRTVSVSPQALSAPVKSSPTSDLVVTVTDGAGVVVTATLSAGWSWVSHEGPTRVSVADGAGRLTIGRYDLFSPDTASTSGTLTVTVEGAEPVVVPLTATAAPPVEARIAWVTGELTLKAGDRNGNSVTIVGSLKPAELIHGPRPIEVWLEGGLAWNDAADGTPAGGQEMRPITQGNVGGYWWIDYHRIYGKTGTTSGTIFARVPNLPETTIGKHVSLSAR